jgi:O-antigen/teichoic acid export membrane protein/aminoglycoside phosphotransferase (APT) family kinase protein
MSAHTNSRIIPLYHQLITHLRTPIYRNGYFLLISSLSTSGIGLIYWILAAHRYPTSQVGINSAIIAAMTLVAGIAELNLMSPLIRFIPLTGRSTKRFVLFAYLASLLISAVISTIFIKNLGHWSPALDFLGNNRILTIWFVISTMSWCIFVLQDSVLTGLRQTSWVPVENTVFSLTKIVLLLMFAASIPAFGIYASWTFALIVAIIPTNYYIFRKLIPIHEKREKQSYTAITPRQVIQFTVADYLSAIFWLISSTLLPVIVTSVSGATANAYFYLAWTIANTLYLIGPAMGSSLIVETAKDQHKLDYYSFRVFSNIMKIVLPAAIIIILGAPYILMIFGKGYSTEGTTLLRLLALSAIPNVVNSVFASTARVQRRMKAVVGTLAILCSMLLGSSYILLKEYGIVGIGIGWVASQSLVAVIVYFTQLRKLWKNINIIPGGNQITSLNGKIKSQFISFVYKITRIFNLVGVVSQLSQQKSSHLKQMRITYLLPTIVSDLSIKLNTSHSEGWTLQRVVINQTNKLIAILAPSNGGTPIVVKISSNNKEAESMRKQWENLESITQFSELGEWRLLLPEQVASGNAKGYTYYVECAKQGITLEKVLENHQGGWNIVRIAIDQINDLHKKTAHHTLVNEEMVESWVDEPLQNISQKVFHDSVPSQYQTPIANIRKQLHEGLLDHQVCVSWIHGDYSPENILVDPQRSQITGILDWELSTPQDLPLLDLMHLLISLRMNKTQSEMGYVVCNLLKRQDWEPAEVELIRAASADLQCSEIKFQDLLLLAWIRHIAANLNKTSQFDHDDRWVNENFLTILRLFSDQNVPYVA